MRSKLVLFALITGGFLIAAAATVSAQGIRTSGALKGVITDQNSGEPLAGATVVVSGEALQGTQAEITDGNGEYFISNLPPGNYLIKVYYAGAEFERPNAVVQLGKTAQVNIRVNTQAGQGEVIQIEGRTPVIDQGSTKTGRTVTEDFTMNIPTGQTFAGVLGTAAGSQDDLYGVSFGGSTSSENVYIVEGINTTNAAYGGQSTNLPNEFIQETEVITAGYSAEYGRSTGGVINVVTKTGSNEFHGSVFGYFTPGTLTADEVPSPRLGSSIDRVNELSYDASIGAELGGPIVKDRLWFHVGFNPSFIGNDAHRIIKTRVNEDGLAGPDIDAAGFEVLREVDRNTLNFGGYTMFFTAKLTGAISPDHQGSVSFLGNPERRDAYQTLTGVPESGLVDVEEGAMDISGKWSSKFNNNKTQVDAVVGFHQDTSKVLPGTDTGDALPRMRIDQIRPFSDFMSQEMLHYGGIPAECIDTDDAQDPLPDVANCPVQFYNLGGIGFREEEVASRGSAIFAVTQRIKLAGQHTFKVGVDLENQTYEKLADWTGGSGYRVLLSGRHRIDRYYERAANGTEMCDFDGDPETPEEPCTHLVDGLKATTTTRNLGAYIQDSWNILPNVTLNAGLRWEQQTLFEADEVKTGDGKAFELSNMLAPRLGLIYDPTQEGRAKLYGHWGRFYESIPMDINARAFGGEISNIKVLEAARCPDPIALEPGERTEFASQCMEDMPRTNIFLGGTEGGADVVDDLKAQFIDEWILGADYELLNDLKVGASYVHREIGRIIEDFSTDGGQNYVIGNPGEGDAAIFDKPTRDYDALQVTAEKRFSRTVMLQGSYTYSRMEGNYPGLFSPETGQLDPNLTSMYDLPELMANRTGPLAADRPHNFKLDSYYILDAGQLGEFTFGSSVRAVSGIPHNVLGAHPDYGRTESYILPRGTAERSPFNTKFDVHVSYGRKLSKTTSLQAFVRIFNLFNQQPGIDVDEEYTLEDVHPCVGCSQSDLRYVKGTDTGANTVIKNLNFGNVSARQDPLSMTLGMRLTF